jgi:hypothetical protein
MQQKTDGRVVRLLTKHLGAEDRALEQWFLVAVGEDDKAKDAVAKATNATDEIIEIVGHIPATTLAWGVTEGEVRLGHIEDIRAKYGEASNAWRVRVLGEFPTADDETVIPLELVLSAIERRVSTLSYYPVWGVDVARYGDDRTALAKRQANRLLEPIKWWNSTDLMATAGRIKAQYEETHYDMRPSEILIDTIGLGAGVYDRCKELGLPVRAINVGEATSKRENCMRLRDEPWFKGREWFQDRSCSMPQDDALIAELTAPTYTFTSTGKLVVESKADMKKRGMRSPDLADAFLLTFACDERRKERYRRPEPRNYSAWAA